MPNTPTTTLSPVKLCMNCKHLRTIPFVDLTFSKCALFGRVELITGKKNFDYADLVRDDDDKCGSKALYFEEKKDWF